MAVPVRRAAGLVDPGVAGPVDRHAGEPAPRRGRRQLMVILRRPLLVTGKPGTGKSTLAYSIAYELALDPVLHWTITSRSTLTEGLYQYDAIGRLHELNVQKETPRLRQRPRPISATSSGWARWARRCCRMTGRGCC